MAVLQKPRALRYYFPTGSCYKLHLASLLTTDASKVTWTVRSSGLSSRTTARSLDLQSFMLKALLTAGNSEVMIPIWFPSLRKGSQVFISPWQQDEQNNHNTKPGEEALFSWTKHREQLIWDPSTTDTLRCWRKNASVLKAGVWAMHHLTHSRLCLKGLRGVWRDGRIKQITAKACVSGERSWGRDWHEPVLLDLS